MKAKINNILREITIVPVQKGGFCVSEGLCFPWFPLFCAICEAITEEEKACGDVLICPISDSNGGHGSIEVEEIKNEVSWEDIYTCICNYEENLGLEEDSINIIVDSFRYHGCIVEDWKIKKAMEKFENYINNKI